MTRRCWDRERYQFAGVEGRGRGGAERALRPGSAGPGEAEPWAEHGIGRTAGQGSARQVAPAQLQFQDDLASVGGGCAVLCRASPLRPSLRGALDPAGCCGLLRARGADALSATIN